MPPVNVEGSTDGKNVLNRHNAPDVHDLVDEHQCMKTGTEWTDVDDLVQCVHMAQNSLLVSCQTQANNVHNCTTNRC